MDVVIRAGRPEDAKILAEFNQEMAHETEARRLDPKVAVRGVENLLSRPNHGGYTVAEVDGEIAGSLMVTTEWSDWRDGYFWWLQSVYVKPEYRKQGVYRALYAHVRGAAKAQPDVVGIRLYVENENEEAQTVYEKLGMKKTAYRLYEEEL